LVTWTFLANVYATLVVPLMAQLQAMLGGVCATMQPIALAMVLLWVCFVGMDIANGSKTMQDAVRDFFIAGTALGALNTAQFTQYISDFFLQAVPNTVSAALGGNGSPVAGLDTVLDMAVTAAAKTYEALPGYALKTIPLALGVLVFLVLALVSVGYCFAVFMTAAIINVLAIVVGPVFLACAATPQTRRFAGGWLGVLVGGCATQFMALATILLLTGGEQRLIQSTVVLAQGDNSNSLATLWSLAQCGLLMALCTAVVKKIPAIGQAIAGGVYHGTAGARAATFGAAATGASIAYGAAKGAAGAAAKQMAAAGFARAAKPTGPSLSAGKTP
jgi:type IV secretory pathway VirB6-like protein